MGTYRELMWAKISKKISNDQMMIYGILINLIIFKGT